MIYALVFSFWVKIREVLIPLGCRKCQFFKEILKLFIFHQNYHTHLPNDLALLSKSVLVFTCSILFTNVLSHGNNSLNASQFFPQGSLFREAGHCVHSSVCLSEIGCLLHIIKDLTTLESNFSTESIPEQCIETVQVLICETQGIKFLL